MKLRRPYFGYLSLFVAVAAASTLGGNFVTIDTALKALFRLGSFHG